MLAHPPPLAIAMAGGALKRWLGALASQTSRSLPPFLATKNGVTKSQGSRVADNIPLSQS